MDILRGVVTQAADIDIGLTKHSRVLYNGGRAKALPLIIMTWKIIDRVSSIFPGSIVYQKGFVKKTYFWDEKHDSWSILVEEYDSKHGLWCVDSIDKADPEWYLDGEVTIEVAEWVHLHLKRKNNDG
jgi:hypothetical protein